METNKVYQGDALEVLKKIPSESVNCIVTSPPYWALRDYGVEGQLGLESTPQEYINKLCDVFDEAKRVLRKDGTCWINIGDTYGTKSGSGFANDNLNPLTKEEIAKGTGIYKANELRGTTPEMHKNLCNIPARFSIEMQKRGWILRNVIIWEKPNCMPSSVKDRFTVNFEYIFFFVKNKEYWFETQREPHSEESINDLVNRGRNKRVDVNYLMQTGTRKMGVGFGEGEHGSKNLGTGMDADKKGRDRLEFYHPDGRCKRAVWKITTKPFKESHFATFPEELIETPIKAGCPEFVCNKCGKPREKLFKYNNLKEEGHGELVKYDEPYAVQHREGEILVRDLPEEKEILEYLRKWKTISLTEISKRMDLPLTSCSHWFSDLDSTHGFSYPTKEQWIKLKEILQFDDIYDEDMTKEYYKSAEVMGNEYKEVGLSDCGCNAGFSSGIVLDMFFGAGTTGIVALKQNKKYIGIELNPNYIDIINVRLKPHREQIKLSKYF